MAGRYLVTIPEEREARIAAETRAAAAEARTQQLEEELRRLRGQSPYQRSAARIAAETRAAAAEARTQQLEEELRRLRGQ